MEIRRESRVRAMGNVYARPFGEELVLLDFGRGEYFALDPIGAEIWKGIEDGQSLGSIVDALVEAYDVTAEQALADVVRLVAEMKRRSLVETLPDAA